jgi:hypothetical protein
VLAQFGDAQPRREALVLPPGPLAIEQKPEPFVMAEAAGFPVGDEFGEGLGHAMQAKGAELIEGGMLEQAVSPNCSSAAHGCWRAGSAFLARGTPVEAVVEDGFDRAVGPRADVDGAFGGGFQALGMGTREPDDA